MKRRYGESGLFSWVANVGAIATVEELTARAIAFEGVAATGLATEDGLAA
jgi:hypothetical protein